MKTERDIELEIVKSLRQNWVPPDTELHESSRNKIEPGKLSIKNVYCNDKRDESNRLKQERQLELEEVRKSFAEKRESDLWEDKLETTIVKQVEVRPRSRSEFRSKKSDDFWMKEKTPGISKESGLVSELDNVRLARQMFVGDPSDEKYDHTCIYLIHALLHSLNFEF